jgi:DNA-binding CsgD family transcriptional regulator
VAQNVYPITEGIKWKGTKSELFVIKGFTSDTLHFHILSISVIPGRKLSLFSALLILVPGIALFALNFFYPVVFSDFVMGEMGWIFVPAAGGLLNLCWVLYASGCFFAAIILMVVWRIRTNLNREKKQIGLLLATQIVAEVLVVTEYLLHDILVEIRPASISPVLLTIWITGMVIAVKRYQFLSITPEAVSREILDSIDELVILINEEEKITYMNRKALNLFGLPFRKLDRSHLGGFLAGESGDDGEQSLIPATDTNGAFDTGADSPFTISLDLQTPGGGITGLTARVSRVDDKYDDMLGYLIIGSQQWPKDAGTEPQPPAGDAYEVHARRWNLTNREADIAALAVKGWKNRRIAKELGISEQTVKNHLRTVYKKCGVSTRVELVNILSEKAL